MNDDSKNPTLRELHPPPYTEDQIRADIQLIEESDLDDDLALALMRLAHALCGSSMLRGLIARTHREDAIVRTVIERRDGSRPVSSFVAAIGGVAGLVSLRHLLLQDSRTRSGAVVIGRSIGTRQRGDFHMTDSTETEKPKPPPATFRVLVFIVAEDGDGKPKGHVQSYDKEHENPLTALVDLSEAMEVSFPTPTDYSMARIQQTHGRVLAAFRAFGGKWMPILYPYDDGLHALDQPPAPAADPTPADPAPAAPNPADPTP